MKKGLTITLLFLFIFLIKLEPVHAFFSGSFRYDVDSAELSNSGVIIRGWAAINKGGSNAKFLEDGSSRGTPIDNINPEYELIIEAMKGVTGADVVLKSATIEDCKNHTIENYACNTSKSNRQTNRDYSNLWQTSDDKSCGGSYCEYKNINYAFAIKKSVFTTLAKQAGTEFSYFKLSVRVTVNGYSKKIPIAIQKSVVSGKSNFIRIKKDATKIRNITVYGKVQAVGDSIGKKRWCYDYEKYYTTTLNLCDPLKYTAMYVTGEVFNVKGRSQAAVVKVNGGSQPNFKINNYAVYFRSAVPADKVKVVYNGVQVVAALNGDKKRVAYLPSAWIVPPKPDGDEPDSWILACKEDPKCLDLNAGTCPKTIGEGSKAENCCNSLCKTSGTGYVAGNEETKFCKEVCGMTPEPPEEVCAKDTPMTQYCCVYPGDTTFCNAMDDPAEDMEDLRTVIGNDEETKSVFQNPPEGWDKIILDNSICRIGCQEDLVVTFGKNPVIKAGMGFTYPIGIESTRYCTSEYHNVIDNKTMNNTVASAISNYELMVSWAETGTKTGGASAKIEDGLCGAKPILNAEGVQVCPNDPTKVWAPTQTLIQTYIDNAKKARTDYLNNLKTINSMLNDRSECENFGGYSGPNETTASVANIPNQFNYSISSLSVTEDKAFSNARQKKTDVVSTTSCVYTRYTAPTLLDKKSMAALNGNYCTSTTSTNYTYYDFIHSKYDAKETLNFDQEYYVQTYTGELSETPEDGYIYDGAKAYTDFYDYSDDVMYSIELSNFGSNLPTVPKTWAIDYQGTYHVTNWIFPQEGDSQYDRYGSTGFSFRQITLTDPFPNRSARENWLGKEKLITDKGYKVYKGEPLYILNLSPSIMRDIRGFETFGGSAYGYSDQTNPSNSLLLEQYSEYIRKR